MAIIYIITAPDCREDGTPPKSYIGLSEDTLETRWSNHLKQSSNCRYLKHALNYYGIDNFSKKILYNIDDEIYKSDLELNQMILCVLEQVFIAEHETFCPNGYNLTTGGEIGKKYCEKTKEKISNGLKNFIEKNRERFNGQIIKSGSNYKARYNITYLGIWDEEEEAQFAIYMYYKFNIKLYLEDEYKKKIDERKPKRDLPEFIYKRGKTYYFQKRQKMDILRSSLVSLERAIEIKDHYFRTGELLRS